MIKIANEDKLIYLFGFSPRQGTQLESLINILKGQIELGAKINVVLLHDGVIGASKKGIIPNSLKELLNLSITVYAMIPDLEARGFDPEGLDERIKCIQYEDLVDLLAKVPKIASWM